MYIEFYFSHFRKKTVNIRKNGIKSIVYGKYRRAWVGWGGEGGVGMTISSLPRI